MFEQFRILRAALRRRQFLISELALEIGVSEGTIQRTLHRRTDLFDKEDGPPTGRPGGRVNLYRIKEEAVRNALQIEADSIDLPQSDPALSRALAEDTLLNVLPRTSFEERLKLIEVAGNYIQIAARAVDEAFHALFRLYSALRQIITSERVLREHLPADAKQTSVVWLLEALQSAQQREARDQDSNHLEITADRLVKFPDDILSLDFRENEEMRGTSWLILQAAVADLLANAMWKNVAGDLVRPLAERLRHRQNVSTSDFDPHVVAATAFFSPDPSENSPFGARVHVHGYSEPSRLTHFTWHGSARAIYGYGAIADWEIDASKNSGAFSELAEGLVRIKADYSRTSPIPANQNADPSLRMAQRFIECFDFSFRFRRVVGANTLYLRDLAAPRGNKPPDEQWVQYADIVRSTEPTGHLVLPSGLMRLPKYFSSLIQKPDEHEGVYLWRSGADLVQARLNPGHTIDVYSHDSLADTQYSIGETKSGEVWWIDFSRSTGALITAHVKQAGSNLLIPIPFDDLDYDPGRKCFVIRVIPRIGGASSVAGSVGMHWLDPRPDLFH
jgi:hypothetical protein